MCKGIQVAFIRFFWEKTVTKSDSKRKKEDCVSCMTYWNEFHDEPFKDELIYIPLLWATIVYVLDTFVTLFIFIYVITLDVLFITLVFRHLIIDISVLLGVTTDKYCSIHHPCFLCKSDNGLSTLTFWSHHGWNPIFNFHAFPFAETDFCPNSHCRKKR